MKRVLWMVLACAMLVAIFAASGCSKTETGEVAADPGAAATSPATDPAAGETEVTEEMMDNSKPNEYVKEKLAAGREVLIACCMIADVPILMEVWAGQIEEIILPEGFQWQITAAGGDTGTMLSQIENYVTMGAAAIIMVPPDAYSIKDVVVKAGEAGTYCVTYGLEGVDYCYSVLNDVIESSTKCANMGIAWGKQTFPDATEENPIKFCVMYNANVEDAKKNGENLIKVVNEDPLCEVAFVSDAGLDGVDGGFQIAENALTADPDVRIFLSISGADVLGASNYIMSQPNLNYAEFAAFGMGLNTAGMEAVTDLAPQNKAVLRGSIESELTNGAALATCTLNALYGEWANPYEWLLPNYCFTQPGFEYTGE